ncbi:TRNA/rRNA methyltransferase family protein [Theobroma cacao]|uniref:rRNA methyltransferase 1, mitochondrial n=1 Tax=Theobroma cacao TaxID=3641 RepID=A0A061GMB9_THECC|nr:TRNA/rRNA methyltransferase family protein [Theobroma cacao]
MRTIYSNLTKSQAFPIVVRFSSQTKCIKQFHSSKTQSLPIGSCPKTSLNPSLIYGSHKVLHFHSKSLEIGCIEKPRSILGGFRMRSAVQCCSSVRARSLSSLHSKRVAEERDLSRAGKSLRWLASEKVNEAKGSHKVAIGKTNNRSSWEESLDRLAKENNHSSLEEIPKRLEKVTVGNTGQSSWEESGASFFGKKAAYPLDIKESRKVSMVRDHRNSSRVGGDESNEEKGVREEDEVVDDPRWDKIKSSFRGMGDIKPGSEKPEFRRWNKQESWGRKTWKEATESTVPKMVGEGVYGVGPVLAALSAGRREFYALYVQEGLDLGSNNRKKKDKKGFEKVFRMAEKFGLSVKEVSKHDLNMVVDNRPHQGLVLDASPLEMVKIKELEPVSIDEEKGSLWIALDEVTDPQNLGAIIRSGYFFGASGVVLCAKNSAPLSGVVSKASAGSLELMELRYCKNMMQFLVSSAENGWRVLGASVSSKAVPLNEVLPGVPTILVLGSEGTGLRPLVERSCTQLVRIPGNIPVDIAAREVDDLGATEVDSGCSGEEFQSFLAVESLNVSVAAGVLLHHLIGKSHGINYLIDDKSTDMHQ